MNPFEMVVGIVIVVTIGSLIRSFLGVRRDHKGPGFHSRDQAGDDRLIEEIRTLREEIKSLKKRQAVIERITVEKESSLEREIERLRDQ
jgi:hypothetical protein